MFSVSTTAPKIIDDLKRGKKIFLLLLANGALLFAAGFPLEAQTKQWVTAYVGGWWFNSNNNGGMPIEAVNFKGMTVCDHMCINPSRSGTFLDTTINGITPANSQKLTAAAHAAGVK